MGVRIYGESADSAIDLTADVSDHRHVEELVEHNLDLAKVRKATEMLDPDERTALMLVRDGVTYKEIGERINRTERAIKSLVHRARKKRKKKLGEMFLEE